MLFFGLERISFFIFHERKFRGNLQSVTCKNKSTQWVGIGSDGRHCIVGRECMGILLVPRCIDGPHIYFRFVSVVNFCVKADLMKQGY